MAVRSFAVALGFLTRLPVPRIAAGADDFASAVRLYPLVGIVIGASVAGAGWLGARADPWLGALFSLLIWVGLTGALHLDGLADLADGLGASHRDRDRLLAVMADPHVGSFGATAIALQLAAKVITLHLLVPAGLPILILIPAAARLGPLCWARTLPSLKSSGLGAAIGDAVRRRDLIGWGIALAAASVLLRPLFAAPVLIALLGWWFRRRLGGMTGDIHGAGIELVETGLLVIAAIALASGA